MERGFKTWAEKEAAAVRAQLGLSVTERLSARLLLRHLGAIVTRPDLVPGLTPSDLAQLTDIDPDGWSAVTGKYGDSVFVIINDTHSKGRRESDMHHEAAHLLRNHKPCHLVPVGDMTLRVYDQEAEEEAGWLAGCLHIPRPAVLAAVKRGDAEDVIAWRYVASAEMVRYRRSVTGVDRQLSAGRR
jgi:hypothetical protein